MTFLGLITFNKEHAKNEEEGTDLVLAFLNKINVGGYTPVARGNSQEKEIQNKLYNTEIYKQFLENPTDSHLSCDSAEFFGGEYADLCNKLKWWCCSPIEIYLFATGSKELLDKYKKDCEYAGDELRVIDFDMEELEKIDIERKYMAIVKFHC